MRRENALCYSGSLPKMAGQEVDHEEADVAEAGAAGAQARGREGSVRRQGRQAARRQPGQLTALDGGSDTDRWTELHWYAVGARGFPAHRVRRPGWRDHVRHPAALPVRRGVHAARAVTSGSRRAGGGR